MSWLFVWGKQQIGERHTSCGPRPIVDTSFPPELPVSSVQPGWFPPVTQGNHLFNERKFARSKDQLDLAIGYNSKVTRTRTGCCVLATIGSEKKLNGLSIHPRRTSVTPAQE